MQLEKLHTCRLSDAMPEGGPDQLRKFDAIYFGAVLAFAASAQDKNLPPKKNHSRASAGSTRRRPRSTTSIGASRSGLPPSTSS